MTDVNSNEKAFDLAEALPNDPENPGTIHNGGLMLYRSNTIVLFFESFVDKADPLTGRSPVTRRTCAAPPDHWPMPP